jgi:hypothetical protein
VPPHPKHVLVCKIKPVGLKAVEECFLVHLIETPAIAFALASLLPKEMVAPLSPLS